MNKNDCASPHTKLAKYSVETYIKTKITPELPEDIDKSLLETQAGAFVSIRKNGNLRGCIGTIVPTKESLALEIVSNAIHAATRDYRFDDVTEAELDELTYSVDVMQEPEPISDESLLDVKEYGVIVTSGMRRGLLLPNLEGVDTVSEQISIALSKAGISSDESYELERFKVDRYK